MWNWPDLSVRADLPELMDDRSIDGPELVETLAQLRLINRLLGAAWPTLWGVAYLWKQAGSPKHLSILDMGAGSGDVNRRLLRWAARRNLHLRLILVDIHPDTCAVAQAYYQNEPRVRVIQGNVFEPAVRHVDIVTASLFLHHFPTLIVPLVLQRMVQTARMGVIINDLHRHWLAWAFIRAATHIFSGNRLIRHDAPLSVRRGFRRAELDQLKKMPGLSQLNYSWQPLFRYLIIVPANGA